MSIKRSNRVVSGKTPLAVALASALFVSGCIDGSHDDDDAPPPGQEDRAYYILPPGNFGGVPNTENSTDQLPLYDGLTPLRGNVADADIEAFFIPEDMQPIGETTEEPTGRAGTRILYDEFGVAHISGDTRADVAFGAGWVTMRDRAFLITLGRNPARLAIADVPGINAFGILLNPLNNYQPNAATEQLVSDQVDLLVEVYGDEGREIIADAQAYADGMNAYEAANGIDNPVPYNVNDVVAVTAFIGSIFGAGGGSEATNANFLSTLINGLGAGVGEQAWNDTMLIGDPEAPTTIDTRFEYGHMTGGTVTGSVLVDQDSIISLDPRVTAVEPTSASTGADVLIPAAEAPPSRQASNFLIVDSPQSVNDTNLAVMGPQLGFYYPEIVMQLHLSGPGIEAQGVAVPGLAMYLLIGRTENYAWSLTSANHDVRDVYVEILCNPDDSPATRDSTHYEYNGECVAFEMFEAGTLNGELLRYPLSVHGQMIGTATINEGQPVALTRKRSTFGRDGLNLAGLKDMTEGDAETPEQFWQAANKFGFTFNWGYVSRSNIAYFSSGYLPVRPPGLDRRLPTLGTGEYEWQGFLTEAQHPHAAEGPSGRLLNWNNQSAPGFMHGDGTPYGSVHRVDLFDQFPDQVGLAGVVGVMNRSATEDTRSPAWPIISELLRGSEAPTELAGDVVDLLDAWVADDAPRLDADNDGNYDDAGATIMDALFGALAAEVMRPVFGDLTEDLNRMRSFSGNPDSASVSTPEGASFIDKDLRTLLGKPVEGPYQLQYCGNGDLEDCRDSLWQVVDNVSQELATIYGSTTPSGWLREGYRNRFAPDLLLDADFRYTNRPTFQQVLEFAP